MSNTLVKYSKAVPSTAAPTIIELESISQGASIKERFSGRECSKKICIVTIVAIMFIGVLVYEAIIPIALLASIGPFSANKE